MPAMTIRQFRDVNGYTDSAASVKAEFLRTGRKVLKAVGKALAAKGYTEQSIRINQGGVAVSGEVYADFFKPGEQVGVWFEWSESCVGGGGATILYRWTERHDTGRHTKTGPNQWHCDTSKLDPEVLADNAAEQAETRPAFTGKLC